MSPSLGVLYRDYLPEQLEPVMLENGVSQTVLVQASNSVEETRWLLSLAEAHPFIAGVVGWVDLKSNEVDAQLKEFTSHAKFKGVRHLVESEPADDWVIQSDVVQGLQQLSKANVSYDLLVHTRHLKYVPQVAEKCPDLALVIDHMAKPPIASVEFASWSKALKSVAAFQNIHCKLSGLVTEANWESWQAEDLKPYIEFALEVFGPRRMMFGSDHPVCLLASSYQRVLETFQEILSDVSENEREDIFALNAARFYRLN